MSLLRRVKSLFGIAAVKPADAPNAVKVVGTESSTSHDPGRDTKPDDAERYRRQGNTALQAGRLEIALGCYERFAGLQPENPSAHLNVGFALLSMQRYPQAEAALHRSLQLDASSHETHFFLGCAKAERGDLKGATVSLSQAVTLAPQFDAGWLQLGLIQERQGALAQASQCYRHAVDLQPATTEGWQGLARSALAQRQYPEALVATERWLALDPRASTAHGMRADALRRLGHKFEALEVAITGLALRHDDPLLWQVKGWALIETGGHIQAMDAFQQALTLTPNASGALAGLGSALHGLDRPEEALAVFEELAKIDPDYEGLAHNTALNLMHSLRMDDAIAFLKSTIARSPNDAQLHFDLAKAELTLGHNEAGWQAYEWRNALGARAQAGSVGVDIPAPWGPETSYDGKRIFVASEQGLGDTIQFVRYVPALIEQGASVTLQVPARFRNLITDQWNNCELVTEPPSATTHFDLRCKLMSLPYLMGIADPLGAKFPYVRADESRRQYWRDRVGDQRALAVGLAWAGNPDFSGDAQRSIPLEFFRLKAPEGFRFVSLQFDIRESDQAAKDAWPDLLHFGSEQRDLADTAALIESLDVVVCVDTSIAHLAGALGRPVFILLQRCPDWRWQLDRGDSPWYPSARLIRQDATRQWTPVIQMAMEHLGRLARAKTAASIGDA